MNSPLKHCLTGKCTNFEQCGYCLDLVCKECVKKTYLKYIKKYKMFLGKQFDKAYHSSQYCFKCGQCVCNWFECNDNHNKECCKLYWSFGTVGHETMSDSD
ncbi:hypothetical protein PV-S19_0128 [Pacmanvirus S19]|nr:hypothetical protein PV-S19_0128 [Pacmanvirus S19]